MYVKHQKYCLKCGNVVHFVDSVINVQLWAVNDTDCIQGCAFRSTKREREKIRNQKRKLHLWFASLDVCVFFFLLLLVKTFCSSFGKTRCRLANNVWKCSVFYVMHLYQRLCLREKTPATILFWVNGIGSVGSNNHFKFSIGIASENRERVREKKNQI